MSMTIKRLADEIGVSKQAVYKRVTGKLKNVLAPYIYTEYNRMCFTDEGVDIVKNDFIENPCSTSLPNNESLRNTYVSTPNASDAHTASNTERIQNSTESHTEILQSASGVIPQHTPEQSIHAPERSANEYGASSKDVQFNSKTHTEQTASTLYSGNIHSAPDTERIGNAYSTELQKENEKLRDELAKMKEAMHEKEIELVKSDAEREKLEETIKHLNQRIEDKDVQITEQRQMLQKTDDERKILTASLFRNNEFIERLMRLSLTKRIFGWRNVQKSLMESQNDIADDVTGEGTVNVQTEDMDD